MTYIPTTPELGILPITGTETVASQAIGTIIAARDSVNGAGRFAYLKGCTATVVGSVVTYNQLTGATTLVPNTANLGAPLAVAMAANTATTSYGWYQVGGAAVIKKPAVKVSPAVKLYLCSTVGRLSSAALSGKQVLELITNNAATVLSATSTVTALIQYPFAQGATA